MSDHRLHPLTAQPQPTPIQSVVREHPDDDNVRWLVGVLVELSRRFIGHAIKRYPELESRRDKGSSCGGGQGRP